MPAPNREQLVGALSSLLSGDTSGQPPASPPPNSEPARAVGNAQAGDAPGSATGEHVRTSTGYVREDGGRVFRVSIMLTKGERRRLRAMAEDADVSVTDYVKRAVGL